MASISIAPELAIDEQEAAMLAQAAKSVQDFYNFETSAEVMLWINVIGICGAVYGPRVMAVVARKKTQKKKENKPSPVVSTNQDMPPIIEGIYTPHHAPTE